jgi:trehalose-6-phosphate synthase
LQADVTNLACICTFCEDEPYQEIIQAATLTTNDVAIYFTGKYEGKIDTTNIPLNVKLLGFLSEDEYWSLLASSDIIIDLTLRENCLVCGAYEGVAMAKPLLLSDTAALKSYFTQGCIYVKATQKNSIAQGIDIAIKNHGKLKEEITELKIKLGQDWGEKISTLKTIIYSFTEALKNNKKFD